MSFIWLNNLFCIGITPLLQNNDGSSRRRNGRWTDSGQGTLRTQPEAVNGQAGFESKHLDHPSHALRKPCV